MLYSAIYTAEHDTKKSLNVRIKNPIKIYEIIPIRDITEFNVINSKITILGIASFGWTIYKGY